MATRKKAAKKTAKKKTKKTATSKAINTQARITQAVEHVKSLCQKKGMGRLPREIQRAAEKFGVDAEDVKEGLGKWGVE
jgi:hypothetical protein